MQTRCRQPHPAASPPMKKFPLPYYIAMLESHTFVPKLEQDFFSSWCITSLLRLACRSSVGASTQCDCRVMGVGTSGPQVAVDFRVHGAPLWMQDVVDIGQTSHSMHRSSFRPAVWGWTLNRGARVLCLSVDAAENREIASFGPEDLHEPQSNRSKP